jgi:hypothetical protein
MMDELYQQMTSGEKELFTRMDTPAKIQAYLDTVSYTAGYENRCVVHVMRDRSAHCLDGALFAAAALRRLGYPPRIIDLLPEPLTDDDHVLAIYKVNGYYGALAKSNFVGLRMREPVFVTIRELVMSYFENFYNLNGKKTLRTITRPIRLEAYDRVRWMTSDAGIDYLEKHLPKLKQYALYPPETVALFNKVDDLTYKAGMLAANLAGIYKPKK